MIFSKNMRAWLQLLYHWLPVSQRVKWRLREQLLPLLSALQFDNSPRSIARGLVAVIRQTKSGSAPLRDDGCERALARMLEAMADHARAYGPVSHWIALPFLSTGGAEMVAINFFRALREIRPTHSGLLLITDRKLVSDRMVMPDGVLTLVLDDYLTDDPRYARKQALLRDLLIAARPDCFHNINSEVAWNLVLEEGERLQRFTRLFASIFALQFAPDGHTKIGYAAYFLKKGMPYLSGLLTDNQRFVDDATLEYQLTQQEQSCMTVLYQPCRLLSNDVRDVGAQRLARLKVELDTEPPCAERRPQILWAGRLDAEKRVDLFLDVVRRCTFADFRVFGQVVLGDGESLPALPNLSYEGPFSSPLEWQERFDFDAFIFTSRWEGMPNILIEVGALGIPVIATTVGGVGELITESTGYPLPERPTVSDYEQALRCIMKKPAQALQRAVQLHELVLQRHSWGHFVSRIAAVPDYFVSAPSAQAAKAVDSDVAVMTPESRREQPLVSVIIPCYNQGRYLQESVASALMACRHPMEIIVIDDGSTDTSAARYLPEAEQLAPGIVRIHRQDNCGLSGARNKGIALARGQYVQFLDADDLLAPGKIDAQVAQLQVNPALAASVCNYLLCDNARAQFLKLEEAIARFDLTEQDFLYRWERGFAIPIHCGLFRRHLLDQVQFDTSARAKEDWLFWTSLAMVGTRFGYIHGHWVIYRQHADSMRRSYLSMGQAWLQAGLKIDAMLAGREPLFFESVASWFNQCYRAHPSYRAEVGQRQAMLKAGSASVLKTDTPASGSAIDVTAEVKLVAEAILRALAMLPSAQHPPLVSIVIPIYGHFEFLQGCLESLALQGDVSIEVVCIDDGTPDPRVPLLMQALQGKNSRLVVCSEAINQGISLIQNAGVNKASGKYVAFLDCDDALVPGALQAVQIVLEEHPDVDYLFTDRIDVDETGNTVRVARYGGYENLQFSQQDNIGADLLDGMVASHLKVIRRSVYVAVGGCHAMFSGVQDWELALRIAQKHKLYYLAKPMYRHRIHDGSVTSRDNVAQLRKTNQVRRYYQELQRGPCATVRQVRVFWIAEMSLSLAELKGAWECGELCVVDACGIVNLGQINFLREFNSYFDRIYWSDQKVPASLVGYLYCDGTLYNNGSGSRLSESECLLGVGVH